MVKEWNYAPTGLNLIKGVPLNDSSFAKPVTQGGVGRIATVYKKILYREYTDGTFTQEIPHPRHLGILGPVVRGEVGDTIKVHFKNFAKRPLTFHPHGVLYSKANEGAIYADQSNTDQKRDDSVQPNQVQVYTWFVNEEHAPTAADEDCVTRMYHSHVISSQDVNSGLIGPLLICKRGTLIENSTMHRNVDKEFVILFTEFDENKSWLLDDNIEKYANNLGAIKAIKSSPEFIASNKMASINGYIYGNLPGLDMKQGDRISWHIIGVGDWSDIHSPSFHGHTVKISSHRRNTATLLPATFLTAYMTAWNPGTWLLNCMTSQQFDKGMSALFRVYRSEIGVAMPTISSGMTKVYYLAAEEITWDYGPSGINNIDGTPLTSPGSESAVHFTQADDRIGGRYKKALYVEYTDDTFTIKANRSYSDLHLGFLGPVIRAEVGDEINVFFKNQGSRNYSIHPLGVFYDKGNEGAVYRDGTSGNDTADDAIMPNQTFLYRWTVPEAVAPTEKDAPCITWMYHSNVEKTKDIESGLIGPLIVCKKGILNSGRPWRRKDVQHDFFLRFGLNDESNSWYFNENKNLAGNASTINEVDPGFSASNKMRNINGYMYGNLPGMRMCKGDNVSWHLIGGPGGMHTATFHGNTFLRNGNNHDTLGMSEGSLLTMQMTPDNPGEWKLVCRVNSNLRGGMVAKYIVQEDCGTAYTVNQMKGRKRQYFIAAVEETWDYAPSGQDLIEGKELEYSVFASRYTIPGPHYIGRRNKKAVYREYTDSTFTKQKQRSKDEEYLGILGPLIKAEMGDIIEVVFKNLASRQYSIHPHGLFYRKQDEGSQYKDSTAGADIVDNAIAPGKMYNYEWEVPHRAGPGPKDTDCVSWGYFSDVNPVKDTNSGLVGPLIICGKGTLDDKDKIKSVDREYVMLFTVFDENQSWYFDENIKTYLTDKNPGPLDHLKATFDFWESNLKGTINGYMFGNLPMPKMYIGEQVAWYLLQVGGNTEMHTVHFHGQSILYKSMSYHRGDVYDLLPESFATVLMVPEAVGTWLLHCHVNVHNKGGMNGLFTVMDPTGPPTTNQAPPKGGSGPHLRASFIPIPFFLFVAMMIVNHNSDH
ncbi:hephaestin-like protein isoform X1 [Acropora palmata]|uniref:hephaestin-like protein isoform X1 n=1 Tax=Acropora palmata TaxID=6131 RepID=UPI003DA067B2